MDFRRGWDRGNSFPGGPGFGRPRLNRFRRMMDNGGVQYALDDFSYANLKFGNIASGASLPLTLTIERDSAFDAEDIMASALVGGVFTNSAPIDFQIADGASNRNLMNASIPMMNFTGTGQTPLIFPIKRRFMPSTTITVNAHNFGTATVDDVRMVLRGKKLFVAGLEVGRPLERFNRWTAPTGIVYSEDLFMYDFNLPVLAAAPASVPVTVLTEADSDFEWIYATCTSATAVDAALTATIAGNAFDIQVRDGGSGRDLQDTASEVSLQAGIGTFPFVLPQPRLFVAKTPIVVTFTANPTFAAEIDNIHFTMIGRKLFEQD